MWKYGGNYLTTLAPSLDISQKPANRLIIKNKSVFPLATELFSEYDVQITCEGQRHLGAVVGDWSFRENYISDKVQKWVKDINSLAEIAIEEPQAAYSAYIKSICYRWAFVQGTVLKTSHLFAPLEERIRQTFIPAVIGRKVSDHERTILSLPVRYGDLV